jgi:hypothetical protein
MNSQKADLLFRYHWQLPPNVNRRAARAWLRISQGDKELGWWPADLPAGGDVWKETEFYHAPRPPSMGAGSYTVELCLAHSGHRAWQRLAAASDLPMLRGRVTLPTPLVLEPSP